jgi:hypothetical protein
LPAAIRVFCLRFVAGPLSVLRSARAKVQRVSPGAEGRQATGSSLKLRQLLVAIVVPARKDVEVESELTVREAQTSRGRALCGCRAFPLKPAPRLSGPLWDRQSSETGLFISY